MVLSLGLCANTANCVRDSRSLSAVRVAPERWPVEFSASTWPLCSLIGPNNQNHGIWGTDLGLSARTRSDRRLTVLFGDTWASAVDGCQYSPAPHNDLVGTLPLERPDQFSPGAPAFSSHARSCDLLQYEHERRDDPTSWRRARLFPSPHATRDADALDLSGLRTPTAAFSDGERLFAMFLRFDPALCTSSAECPDGMQCSSDSDYKGRFVGECARIIKPVADAVPDYCRDSADCVPFADCEPASHGVCMASEPFTVETPQGRIAPPWYRDDPKRAVASIVHVAAAIWPDRPADYVTVARFTTNRFLNAAARTVAYFDPEHPENNDYRPGYHTLLIWGRNSFVESSGAQALPFLSYVPLDELRREPSEIVWRPRFFAGFDSSGNPAWSERESDAQPIYGGQARVVRSGTDAPQLEWSEPEFDVVAQMSLSWVEPLSRWVMLYGGDLPAFMVLDPKTFKTRDPVNLQWAQGAIHLRVAEHPWGDWSSAMPVLTRQRGAAYLACGASGPDALPGCVRDRAWWSRPLTLASQLVSKATHARFGEIAGSCLFGEAARAIQDSLSGDPIGRLYAPNILEEWTEDVTEPPARERGERSAELYWNVSTWNPYQVVLIKTQLTSNAGGRVRASMP